MKSLESKLNEMIAIELDKRKDTPNYIGYLTCTTDILQVILNHNIEVMALSLEESKQIKNTIEGAINQKI